ncbi:MAG: undecaprenyl/decaprenyl-phosphate alpha-N-acetylglucosaminyl 1-phosphate transferase [Verrucomicrobiae bacterium]|nr:undecaprenyl/decaprenyl-phosphate alpha-N-acetylglucosaminyl 1-phosphate transferase [Verrucomicrobiae bacterium]
MMHWALAYLYVFDVSFALALVLSPLCERLSFQWKFLDQPDQQRKLHPRPMPLLGGLAVFAAFALNILINYFVFLPLFGAWAPEELATQIPAALTARAKLLVVLTGAAAMLALGAYDDKRELKPIPKLIAQFLIAALLWLAGIRITLFIPSQLASFILTTLWIVTVTNAMNFLDNMDGLCAGVALVCSLLFAFIAAVQQQHLVCLLALALAGALLGFLPHNFKPARIFLGDSGSHFIGYMLAVLPVITTFYQEATARTHLPVLIPVLVLAVPLADMALVCWMRWRRGQPITAGDTSHISHRLLKLGLPETWAVTLIYLITLTLGLGATVLLWAEPIAAAIVLAQAIGILAIVTLLEQLGSQR